MDFHDHMYTEKDIQEVMQQVQDYLMRVSGAERSEVSHELYSRAVYLAHHPAILNPQFITFKKELTHD